MIAEDSFSDSDEIFNVFSTKNIIETFKTQLQQIVSTKTTLNNELNETENDQIAEPKLNKKRQRNSSPIQIVYESLLDESITVIDDDSPKTRTRQSARLKSKRCKPSSVVLLDTPEQPTKKKRGRKKKNNSDEIVILDSPNLTKKAEEEEENEDEYNPEVSVKVIWKSVNVKKFQLRRFQKMSEIFEKLSNEEKISKNKIILTLNNVKVNPNDTPDSLNLEIYHFLEGGEVNKLSSVSGSSEQILNCNSNSIVIKFQDVNKKVVKVAVGKNEKMKVGMIKCSEQLEVPLNKIKFYFDGDALNPSETPLTLGLENDEVIDIKICV